MRSASGINGGTKVGGVTKASARLVECVAVTSGASVRLLNGRLGIPELFGSGALTAISASPPPGATPRLVGLPTLLTQPPPLNPKMPQLSGCPSYLKGNVPLLLGPPSTKLYQRQRSTPPGTPRIDST